MPLDGAGTEEELGADLRIRPAGERQPRDVLLLRCELIAGVVSALADRLTGREQLVSRALGKPFSADRLEHVMRAAQLLARVGAAALAAQPLSVQQTPARELQAQARPSEALDRLAVLALRGARRAPQG